MNEEKYIKAINKIMDLKNHKDELNTGDLQGCVSAVVCDVIEKKEDIYLNNNVEDAFIRYIYEDDENIAIENLKEDLKYINIEKYFCKKNEVM